MKIVYIVLDGAGDGFQTEKKSLSLAHKPAIDNLARTSVCGLVYTVGRGIAPESDVAVLSLLGYDPDKYYTGRGPLEALGAGIRFNKGQLALRANYATIDPATKRIIDRRAGRSVTTEEARLLAEAIDGMELDGGRARALFRATIGHRGVLVIKHDEITLSADISNTDPAYERVGRISHARTSYEPYVQEARPLADTVNARKAAELVNEFTWKAVEILDKHPVNEDRRRRGLMPANAVLLRDAGDRLPEAEPFPKKYGLNMASIVEMVVERGIALALGLANIELGVDPQTVDKPVLLRREAELALQGLREYDGVYVHLKGPDEPGHDGDLEAKIKAIEEIDKYFMQPLIDEANMEELLFIITSDHPTPWHMKSHSGEPVPLMISHPRLNTGRDSYSEDSCKDGELGVLEKGYLIIPTALHYLEKLQG